MLLRVGLNSTIALTGMNLIGGHYPREGSFIKLTKFGGTKIEDLNEWLERFNCIAETI